MSNSKSQKQHSSSSLEGWLERDKAIALRAHSALEKFSPEQLANLYATCEVVIEQQNLLLENLTRQNLKLLKAVGIQIKEMPEVTQAEVNEVDGLMSLEESLEKVRQLGHVEASYKGHNRAKQAVEAKHNKPGGSRERQAKVREAWASGKYSSKDRCAEEECGALGMSFASARKALRNQPEPT
jgi:hypothetical protein